MSIKSVCVFCGSSSGNRPEYAEEAERLARSLAEKGITIVYGGARVGIMGKIADTAIAQGGKVIGVIPKSLVKKEVAHHGLTELHVVESMHERKAMMAELSDAFIAFPGGIGTLEELFEVWSWAQLGIHSKPCCLYNITSYFDHLLAFVSHASSEGFIKPQFRDMLIVADSPEKLISLMESYKSPSVNKWLINRET